PLSSVLSSASLIKKYRDKGDLSRIDKHIDRIKSSVHHLTNILNDFLSLGKLEEGKVEVVSEEIDVEEIFEDIAEELRLTLKPGQEIRVNCQGAKRKVLSDPKVLRNITFNLVSNASKYSDEGKTIYLDLTFDSDKLRIDVRDEGVGIPEDEARHIFERFYRASNGSNIQGTGLALNNVKRYVGLMHGTIDFTSEFGKGSTFTVTLPC